MTVQQIVDALKPFHTSNDVAVRSDSAGEKREVRVDKEGSIRCRRAKLQVRGQIELINVFHDGWLVEIVREGNDLRLKVEIYLAAGIHSAYSYFYLTLHNVRHFVYYDYPERATKIPAIVTDFETIIGFEPEFLGARMQDDLIEISFSPCHRTFGKLLLSADAAIVQDEGGNGWTLEQLHELSEKVYREHVARQEQELAQWRNEKEERSR